MLTLKERERKFLYKANLLHKGKYYYHEVDYKNSLTKVKILCLTHGFFLQTPGNHLSGKGCAACYNNKRSKLQTLNTETIIRKFKEVHNRYDYSYVNYVRNNKKVKIICNIHGCFLQTPNNHLSGKGCAKCTTNVKYTKNSFLDRANKVHSNKYKYLIDDTISCFKQIKIICPIHKEFKQIASNHLYGSGCHHCANNILKNTDTFVKEAKVIHKNKYNYKFVNYLNSYTKVKIICMIHGPFNQAPTSHLMGRGCKKCTKNVSKLETLWLDSLNISKENRQISLPGLSKKIKVDGYNPITKTVYEFYGDYWHGKPFKKTGINPNVGVSFNTLYYRTINKEQKIQDAGYDLITIWESDFKSNK